MQTIERSATVPYSAQQMYDLVNDVARYPEFIPFCLQGVVHEHRSDFMRASLVLGKGVLSHKLTTVNSLVSGQSINMAFESGPLKSLEGKWQFTELEGHTQISFQADFELLAHMSFLKPMFTRIMDDMVMRFCQRARDIYGD